jgi:hypothetical protein
MVKLLSSGIPQFKRLQNIRRILQFVWMEPYSRISYRKFIFVQFVWEFWQGTFSMKWRTGMRTVIFRLMMLISDGLQRIQLIYFELCSRNFRTFRYIVSVWGSLSKHSIISLEELEALGWTKVGKLADNRAVAVFSRLQCIVSVLSIQHTIYKPV